MWAWLHTGWLRNALVVGWPSVVAALVATAGLWEWLGKKWVEQHLGERLEKFKTDRQKELEGLKSEQQKDLERLRHLLSSRISKIHEKEFEVLPKAWLALNRGMYFSKAMAEIYVDDAKEKQRIFYNYLIENRIFMTFDLRKKFSALDGSLSTLLNKYSVQLVHSSEKDQDEVNRLKGMIDDVEQAIQERLHYGEA
jgi:hypothetical protein